MQRASRRAAPRRPPLAAVLLLATICCFTSNAAAVTATTSASFSYPVVHRFSDRAKEMLQRRGAGGGVGGPHADFGLPWPRRNSAEYHHQLFQLDQARHHARRGRQLSTQYLAFSGDNTTLQWLASLHYTVVDVGTPAVSFFAALDTGSDLTWFPCDCIRCANLDDARIDPQIRDDLNVYSPQSSSTSQNVTCSDSLCKQQLNCTRATDWCPYVVNYVSADTGTQGNLVRDVLYLGNDLQPTGGPLQTAPVVFGCGRQQTGDFITAAAIDGLVGLGYASEALPSQLARQGLIANSFSVCLSEYDEGRFVFGDKGVPGQSSTPFLAVNNAYVSYTVQAQRITVGSRIITTPGENFFFDTGTSFTYLYSETYRAVTEAFDAEVPSAYVRTQYSGIPFEFCYSGSARANYPYFDHPNITFTWYGGDTMELIAPTLELETQEGRIVGFCLAVTDGGNIALFGQKYMIGYRFTFDREENILGWTKSSCFDQSLAGAEETPPAVSPTLPPPTTAPTPSTTAAPSTAPTGPPVLPPTEAPLLPPSGVPAPPPSAPAAPPLVPATSPPPPPRVSTPPPPPQVPPTPTSPRTSTPAPSTSPNSSGSSCPVYLLATILSVLAVAASQFTVHF